MFDFSVPCELEPSILLLATHANNTNNSRINIRQQTPPAIMPINAPVLQKPRSAQQTNKRTEEKKTRRSNLKPDD
jgi:hypothetical protein